MNRTEAEQILNGAITGLCDDCNPGCPKSFEDGKLPHCYANRRKRVKLGENIIHSIKEDSEFDSFVGYLDLDNLPTR